MCHDCHILGRSATGGGLPGDSDSLRTDAGPLHIVGRPAGSALAVGSRVAQYQILALLGTGGMGEVYRATDTRLDRAVAIKVLRRGARAPELLVREAQAMARLSHANVVTVHEVGVVDGQLFIAMEFVDGQTLRAWRKGTARSWRETLAVFARAGSGLAAAHRAGVVHCDFKPDNVLVGKDGRVCVTDFGVASFAGGDVQAAAAGGTPRYMAPEQREGKPVDARTDQYSFAVALHESLFDSLPEFDGGRLLAARGANVPGWLRSILARALSADPAHRFPGMDAMLAALGRDPFLWRKRALAFGAVAAAAALFVVRSLGAEPCAGAELQLAAAWDAAAKAAVHRAFSATGRAYAEPTWTRVEQILDHYSAAWAAMRTEACVATVVRHDQSEALMDLRMGCLDRRRGELEALAALFARGADPAVLDGAVGAARALGDLADCADREALGRAYPPPADHETRARAAALRPRLDAVEALLRAGQYKEALPLARRLAEDARSVAHPPAVAEAVGLLASIETAAGDPDAAERHHEAILAASQARDDDRVATLWTSLMVELARRQAKYDAALALVPAAQSAVVRAGDDPRQRAALLDARAIALNGLGRTDEARADQERALATVEKALGPSHLDLASILSRLSVTLRTQGKYAEARAQSERALAIVSGQLGPGHPQVAEVLLTLAQLANDASAFGDAQKYAERARDIFVSAEGPENADVARAMGWITMAFRLRGRLEEARQTEERALAMLQKALGPDHLDVARAWSVLGSVLLEEGRYADALDAADHCLSICERKSAGNTFLVRYGLMIRGHVEYQLGSYAPALADSERQLALNESAGLPGHLNAAAAVAIIARVRAARGELDAGIEAARRALAMREKAAGTGSAYVAASLDDLGDMLQAKRACAEARAYYARALDISDHVLAENPERADALIGTGECQLAERQSASAVATLEDALAFLLAHPGPKERVARARLALARALRQKGSDRPRALELAGLARGDYAAVGGARYAAKAREVDQQLADWRDRP